MKNIIYILILPLLLLSWHPYVLKIDKKEENLKGPVKTVIEYNYNWGNKNIVVKNYNKKGKLIHIKFYGLGEIGDSICYGEFFSVASLTGRYRG